ncbi:MAG: endolytic transglycosylase MltG [Paludibacter sp.]|nr:endolytic transglycosylase MltG [Paludibacter sp.]
MSKNKKSLSQKILLAVALTTGLFFIFAIYAILFPNTSIQDEDTYLYISDDDQFEDVLEQIKDKSLLINDFTFKVLAKQIKYDQKIRPGRYKITPGMSNFILLRKLRGGKQDPVKLVINNIRTKEQLAGRLSSMIMADSLSIINALNDSVFLKQYDLNPYNAVIFFIPNTYEVFWDTDTKELFDRMKKEFNAFWNEDRLTKAAAIPMTQTEVMTLASIVEEETNKKKEHPIIAGLYINRLKINMPLQACPTIRFALNDYTINRVLIRHLQVKSPYNTYKNKGLPPGPIRLPSPTTIDAVLNYEKHDYLFMTAKETLNGEHNFAVTYAEHSINAKKYQQELNRLGIK